MHAQDLYTGTEGVQRNGGSSLNDGSMHYAIESFPNFNIRAADWPKINCPAMLQRQLMWLHHTIGKKQIHLMR
jgi:hypothetical protein